MFSSLMFSCLCYADRCKLVRDPCNEYDDEIWAKPKQFSEEYLSFTNQFLQWLQNGRYPQQQLPPSSSGRESSDQTAKLTSCCSSEMLECDETIQPCPV